MADHSRLSGRGAEVVAVPGWVAASASFAPGAVALREGAYELTYGDLVRRADRLAVHLAAAGVGPETLVAICAPRSVVQIVAVLAVWRAGGAFVPLDPAWPAQRIRQLVADADPRLVLATAATAEMLVGEGRKVLGIDGELPHLTAVGLPPASTPDLAYVIYTSGSTGRPKGVEITHANLASLVGWHVDAFGVTAADRASHLAGLGFDASVWEVWPYLATGASVTLAPDAVRASPALLRDWLVDERIDIAFVPTPLAQSMIVEDWPASTRLRLLLTGGDALHARPRQGLPFAVVNNYGPTECTVVATSGVVAPAGVGHGLPPIGRAISGTAVRLVDAGGAPVADGEEGELWIAGPHVGRGYRGDAALTAERFVTDPVSGERFYRTGDLGCRLPDGDVAFRGRIDQQVKIRGHRIEPGEVAALLDSHPAVASSAVVAREAGGTERRLVAYVVPQPGSEIAARDLRDLLAASLPDFMVPAAFVRLDALPVTANGKLDRAALPEPDATNALPHVRYRAPGSPTEERLAAILADLLGIGRVGVDDSFFLLGGHSLLGTQVVLRAREAFGVELTLWHLFEAQTVANLAAKVEDLLIEKLSQMSDDEAARLMTAS